MVHWFNNFESVLFFGRGSSDVSHLRFRFLRFQEADLLHQMLPGHLTLGGGLAADHFTAVMCHWGSALVPAQGAVIKHDPITSCISARTESNKLASSGSASSGIDCHTSSWAARTGTKQNTGMFCYILLHLALV